MINGHEFSGAGDYSSTKPTYQNLTGEGFDSRYFYGGTPDDEAITLVGFPSRQTILPGETPEQAHLRIQASRSEGF